ncbi:MAG: hypothetical protein GX057_06905 [Clostridiales bacterium]|jgi:ribosomal protein L7Ae-like RNA K-turn-binding protein|nr:hypothetical protein [Clostridiales bacterium]HOA85367.1 ribosomal L7Ae/L30e/S12e/Gadd45 family protein [Bacillota bacterium]
MEKQTEKNNRLLLTLGLCARAGALIYGTEQICVAFRRGRQTPLLVIEASDTSANTHKKLTDKCKYYKVRHTVIPHGMATLGRALGRSEVAAVGITDPQLCRAVEKQLDRQCGSDEG